ncbi:MAG: THAP domain-containing protein [Gammaproteobacteria bacterium]|nr:THAP domain-containing protein [Gammaproteobacteria bacterium]
MHHFIAYKYYIGYVAIYRHMGFKCAAFGCRSGYDNTNNESGENPISMFSFPRKNPEILDIWLRRIRRENYVVTESSRLCSLHFVESDYLVERVDTRKSRLQKSPARIRKRLKDDAMPTIFPNMPSYYSTNKTPTASARSTRTHREARHQQLFSTMEATSEDFLKRDNIYSLVEVEQKFEEEECSSKLGFRIIHVESEILLAMFSFESVPTMIASILIHDDLSWSSTASGQPLDNNLFRHILTGSISTFGLARGLLRNVQIQMGAFK